jgi:hypothetical protein
MFQRSQILDELIPPAHTESSVTFSSRSTQARDSGVNLLYHLADHLSRGFLSADDQFRARRLKWLKLFSLWFPGFKSKKPKWLKFRICDILRSLGFLLCWFEFLLRHITIFLVVLNFGNCGFLYTLFTLCPFVTKRENIFVLDRECISKPVKYFLSQNDQRGSLLVFYIGNILVDNNTLCNGCDLTGWSVLKFRIFMYSDNVQIEACDWSQASWRYSWRVLENSKANQSVPVQSFGRAIWRRSDAPQCLTDKHWRRPDVRATSSGR